jgi:hypothetical protein
MIVPAAEVTFVFIEIWNQIDTLTIRSARILLTIIDIATLQVLRGDDESSGYGTLYLDLCRRLRISSSREAKPTLVPCRCISISQRLHIRWLCGVGELWQCWALHRLTFARIVTLETTILLTLHHEACGPIRFTTNCVAILASDLCQPRI